VGKLEIIQISAWTSRIDAKLRKMRLFQESAYQDRNKLSFLSHIFDEDRR